MPNDSIFSKSFFDIVYLALQQIDGISPVFRQEFGCLPGPVQPLTIALEDSGLLQLIADERLGGQFVALVAENGCEFAPEDAPARMLLERFQMSKIIAVLRQLR